MTTRDVDRGRKKIIEEIAKLKKSQIKIGFWGGLTPPSESTGPNFATIMFFNEFGTEHIPSRPAMRQAFENNRDKYQKILTDGMNEIYDLKSTATQVLTKLAVEARNDLMREITEGKLEANKPSTIAQKGSSNPLVEDGHLRLAPMWEIKS